LFGEPIALYLAVEDVVKIRDHRGVDATAEELGEPFGSLPRSRTTLISAGSTTCSATPVVLSCSGPNSMGSTIPKGT